MYFQYASVSDSARRYHGTINGLPHKLLHHQTPAGEHVCLSLAQHTRYCLPAHLPHYCIVIFTSQKFQEMKSQFRNEKEGY
ncbi:hypothetical protein E2C01_029967 [Portunus trituberculatus]|uniref:Uncharacterized protein n=1 Tax=Portunus trituberculatus TaxID=210409 RepID=A0A5B7ETG6_PORTR|nr:hypothetical protein [Portunus trituberculatus]